MNQSDVESVPEAFVLLLQQIDEELQQVSSEGAQALSSRQIAEAELAIEVAKNMLAYRARVEGMRNEWLQLRPQLEPASAELAVEHSSGSEKQFLGKLPRGLRTKEEAFWAPILRGLVALGGDAPMNDVLGLVGTEMSAVLNQYDVQSLPSDPHSIRWRNTAQWARMNMVNQGLLRSDSPHGTWAITEEGRDWLRRFGDQP